MKADCCADLEERVAELEATTVRKGNRKVSLTISGFVSHNVMYWNDGTQNDVYIGDGGNYGSRFRFTGTAKISPQLQAGFLYEFAANATNIGLMNQLNGGSEFGNSGAPPSGTLAYGGCGIGALSTATIIPSSMKGANTQGCVGLRDSTVWLKHSQLGMIKVGHGSTATDNLVLIDLGGIGGASSSDQTLFIGNMIIRGKDGRFGTTSSTTWTSAFGGFEAFDTARRNHILYETPTLMGFSLQAAIAEDNFWDVALRYSGEFSGFRVAGGIGYMQESAFNYPFQTGSTALTGVNLGGSITGANFQNGNLCTQNCDVKFSDVKGSASIHHVPTGLFGTGAAAFRQLTGNNLLGGNGVYVGPDMWMFYLAGGVNKNFFGFGNTTLFGEWEQVTGGLAQNAFINGNGVASAPSAFNGSVFNVGGNDTATMWGFGVTQKIDAASMEIFATYKNYSLNTQNFQANNANLNNAHDLSIIMMGTKIEF